jgi:hypothetical protein
VTSIKTGLYKAHVVLMASLKVRGIAVLFIFCSSSLHATVSVRVCLVILHRSINYSSYLTSNNMNLIFGILNEAFHLLGLCSVE